MRRATVDRPTVSVVWFLTFLLSISAIACGDDDGSSVPDGGDGAIEGGPNPEAGPEGGPNPEAGAEGGNPMSCDQSRVGTACENEAVPCGNGEGICVTARGLGAIGGPNDPIDDLPEGTDPERAYDVVAFADGYCAPKGIKSLSDATSCDPAMADSCGSCASCIPLSGGSDPIVMCLRNCEPSWTEPACPTGNACVGLTGGGGVCLWGDCQTDDECRITRVDTNENGEIDAYDPATNPDGDRLKYFTDADIAGFSATCNQMMGRCEHTGTADAEAGDPCTHNFECEANGVCSNGVCTKFDCDLAGNECAGDGVCLDGQCMKGCRWGVYNDDDPTQGPVDCGEGQSCVWDGLSADGMNGGCIAGNYNDVAEPNLGKTCLENADCYSPNGEGECWAFPNVGLPQQCAVPGCGQGPGGQDLCGEGNICLRVSDGETACVPGCTQGSDCADGLACYKNEGEENGFCIPLCQEDGECSTGTCNAPEDGVGLCETTCSDNNSCGEGLACLGIANEPMTPDGGTDAGDAGMTDPEGICLDICLRDEECPDGTVCNARLGGFTGADEFVRSGRCTTACEDDGDCTAEGEICASANDDSDATACSIWCDSTGQCGEDQGCQYFPPGTTIPQTGGGMITIEDTYGLCINTCADADVCVGGWSCRAALEGDNTVCMPTCTDPAQCREGEICDIPEGEDEGTCSTEQ